MRIKSIKLDRGTVSSFFLMFVEELVTLALPMDVAVCLSS